MIEIKKLNFSYETEEIIKNIDFELKKGTITTLIGNTGGGKTTFVKLMIGLLKGTGEIKIIGENNPHENIHIMREIGVVIGNPKNNFVTDLVKYDLVFPLENLQMNREEIKKYLEDIIKEFELEQLLDRKTDELNNEEAAIVAVATALITKPKILILDDAFTKVGMLWKKKIFRILKRWNRKYELTILNVTHDIEECLFGHQLYILYHGSIVLNEKISVLSDKQKELKQYHCELPFMIELSEKLKYYNLLDHTILDMNRMVNKIWK